jgi:hypothetical protein
MSTTGLVYNLGRVTRLASPHQDTHTQIHHTKTLCCNHLRNLLWCTQMCTQPHRLVVPSYCRLHQVNTDFGSTSHMPPTDLHFRLPQNLLVHPTLGYLSSIFATLPQFFLASELCLRLSLLFLLSKNFSFLGCVPLCSYRDSKGHQCETHVLWVCRAPS